MIPWDAIGIAVIALIVAGRWLDTWLSKRKRRRPREYKGDGQPGSYKRP